MNADWCTLAALVTPAGYSKRWAIKKMKLLLWLLILLECFLLFAVFTPWHIRSSSHARAFVNQRQNPTPETERVWQEENRKYKRQTAITNGVLLAMILSNAGAIIWTAKKIKKSAQPTDPADSQARG